MKKLLLTTVAVLALGGCSVFGQPPAPISQNPVQTAVNQVGTTQGAQVVVTDIQDANWNLQQAQALGILTPADPVQACLGGVMVEAGIPAQGATTPTPVASFTPEIGGLASSGSVLYILAIQAKSLTGNPAGLIPASCQQIVGNLVINALMAPLNANLGAISALLPGSAQPRLPRRPAR